MHSQEKKRKKKKKKKRCIHQADITNYAILILIRMNKSSVTTYAITRPCDELWLVERCSDIAQVVASCDTRLVLSKP